MQDDFIKFTKALKSGVKNEFWKNIFSSIQLWNKICSGLTT